MKTFVTAVVGGRAGVCSPLLRRKADISYQSTGWSVALEYASPKLLHRGGRGRVVSSGSQALALLYSKRSDTCIDTSAGVHVGLGECWKDLCIQCPCVSAPRQRHQHAFQKKQTSILEAMLLMTAV